MSVNKLTDEHMRHLAAIRALPQAAHIDNERALAWLGKASTAHTTLGLDGLVRRLAGIGASEIGALIQERRGEYVAFGCAREVVADKLLLRAPQPPNGNQYRGVELEPLIRNRFRAAAGAQPDTAAIQAVLNYRDPEHPWLLCTPDDIVRINGLRVLVDYKAPATPMTGVSFSHAAQLAHSSLVAERAGFPVDLLLLVPWNLREWRFEMFQVEPDPQLRQAIIAAGDHYWNRYVLAGELPPYPSRRAFHLDEAARQRLQPLFQDLAIYQVLIKEASAKADAVRAEIEAIAGGHRLGKQAINLAGVHLSAVEKPDGEAIARHLQAAGKEHEFLRPSTLDVEKMAARLVELGDSLDAYRQPPSGLDAERAATYLEAQGIPHEQLFKEQLTAGLTRASKGRAAEAVAALKLAAGVQVATARERLIRESEAASMPGPDPEGPGGSISPTILK